LLETEAHLLHVEIWKHSGRPSAIGTVNTDHLLLYRPSLCLESQSRGTDG
jgi:hypothetical protein